MSNFVGKIDLSPVAKAFWSNPLILLNPLDFGYELIRPEYFKKAQFDSPKGDPGWFGPDSAVWHVHSHTPALLIGLLTAARIEMLHPSIIYAAADHSRIPVRENGVRTGQIDATGALIRAAHSFSFFMAVAYGSSAAAEGVCRAVAGMHTKLKGVRPDGLPYDADEPEFFRWTYATVVWGLATAHEHYHHHPLGGAALDQYYREFTRVGEALGGTELPATKKECLEVLNAGSEATALSQAGAEAYQGLSPRENPLLARTALAPVDWAVMEMQPPWAQRLFGYRPSHPLVARIRRTQLRTALAAVHTVGEVREIAQARRRVAGRPAQPDTRSRRTRVPA